MITNGEEPSPCFGCPDKDFRRGCHVGCERRDGYLARRQARQRQAALEYNSKAMLVDGIRKQVKHRGKRRV